MSYVSCAVSPHRRFELLPFRANFFFSRRRGDFSRRPHGAHPFRDVGIVEAGTRKRHGASGYVETVRVSRPQRTLRGDGSGRRDACGRAVAHPPDRILRAGHFRQGDALRLGRSDRIGPHAFDASGDRTPFEHILYDPPDVQLRPLPPDEGHRAFYDDQGALHADRTCLLLPVDDSAAGQFPRLRLQQLRQGTGRRRAGFAGGHEPLGLQTPLRRAFQRQRLPLDDAPEGAEGLHRHPRRRGQHQGADEQVRVPSLHAVQPFLQELPSGDARAADQLDQEEIGPPAATDKKDEKETSPQVSFFRCDAG